MTLESPGPEATESTEDLRYPIGPFQPPQSSMLEERLSAVATLAELPTLLRNAVDPIEGSRLDTPYRDGGWTVRQLVHHIADSHMNAYVRVRLALTADSPTIVPYDEAAWAELEDSKAPIEWSLSLIESLHARWVMMLQPLTAAQWQRAFLHPENGPVTVELATLTYAWHSRHHVAHITRLCARNKW